MSETSIIWLKVLLIYVAACPLVYVWSVLFANRLIIIDRKTKGTIQQTLKLIAVFTWITGVMSPMLLGAKVGSQIYYDDFYWAFLIWIGVLHILSVAPSIWYLHEKRRRDVAKRRL